MILWSYSIAITNLKPMVLVLAPNGFKSRNRQHSDVTVPGAWEGEAPAEPREGVTSESLQSQGEKPFGARCVFDLKKKCKDWAAVRPDS